MCVRVRARAGVYSTHTHRYAEQQLVHAVESEEQAKMQQEALLQARLQSRIHVSSYVEEQQRMNQQLPPKSEWDEMTRESQLVQAIGVDVGHFTAATSRMVERSFENSEESVVRAVKIHAYASFHTTSAPAHGHVRNYLLHRRMPPVPLTPPQSGAAGNIMERLASPRTSVVYLQDQLEALQVRI